MGRKNGTKEEALDGKGIVDADPMIWEGVDSLKPSLCDMEVASDICMRKAVGMKVGVGKGMEACRNISLGSTGIPVGANVRAVGT